MKRILSLQMLAATMFSAAFHAQGHFDWVKTWWGTSVGFSEEIIQ